MAIPKNKTLEALVDKPMEKARELFGNTRETARVHADLAYRAKSWRRERRVVVIAVPLTGGV